MKEKSKVAQIKRFIFLKDIFFIAISAFGGPQAHFAMIQRKLVEQRKYLSQEELLEINALCQMLPGPSSTQTLTSIGYKLGGPFLAMMTLLVWIMPATIMMTLLVLSYNLFNKRHINTAQLFRFLQPLAVGFIASAAFRITRTTVHNQLSLWLCLISAILSCIFSSPALFPVLLIIGGLISFLINRQKGPKTKIIINFNWKYAILFVAIFASAAILALLTRYKPVVLFETTFRFGSLVFGGGNVLIPMMYEQFVQFKGAVQIPKQDFISGVGLAQLIPGPVFSFATYIGGMSVGQFGTGVWIKQVIGCIIATLGIFLPGLLIIFIVYPLWSQFKAHHAVQRSLDGINAVAAGFVIAAAVLLWLSLPESFSILNGVIIIVSMLLLLLTKIPSPIMVIIAIMAGYLI